MDSEFQKAHLINDKRYLWGNKLAFIVCKVALILVSYSLWVDALTGFLNFYVSESVKLSLLYKLVMLVLMLVVIGARNLQLHAVILLSICVLMLGSINFFLHTPELIFLINDLSLTLKMITPFIVFSFCKIVSEVFPGLFNQYAIFALRLGLLAVVLNLMIGILGFGYKSYSIGEGGVGIKGFYVAGNELGGAIVILFGFALHFVWNYKKKYFYFTALFSLFCGLLVSTKAVMLSTLLLCIAIPFCNGRRNLFKLKFIIPAFLLFLFVLSFWQELFEWFGIYEKLLYTFEHNGIRGVIYSGRLDFTEAILSSFFDYAGIFEYLFGIGILGISHICPDKYFAEIDFVDMFTTIGIVGSLLIYFLHLSMLRILIKDSSIQNFAVPIIVLVNALLILLSFFSGHIFNSGLIGPIWGLFNALAFLKLKQAK